MHGFSLLFINSIFWKTELLVLMRPSTLYLFFFNVSVSCTLSLVSVHPVMSDIFCSSMDCSLLVSSVHGISHARILELSAIPPSGIFLTQESNPSLLSLLHWQVNSVPLAPPGKTCVLIYCLIFFFWNFHNIYLAI